MPWLNFPRQSAPHEINFLVILPDEKSARLFAESIVPHFDTVGFSEMENERSLKWDVTATGYMVPIHRDISKVEEVLAIVAGPVGGRNDGWGCFNMTE